MPEKNCKNSCQNKRRPKSLKGQKFGKWTVISDPISSSIFGYVKPNYMSECQCECGRISLVFNQNLKRGVSASCQYCHLKKSRPPISIIKKVSTKHGKWGTPEYNAWRGMKSSCYSKNCRGYKTVGAKGITVFEPWKSSFIEFFNYMGKKPNKTSKLIRVDRTKNYEPGNVKWLQNKCEY